MTDLVSPIITILTPEQGSKNNSLNPKISFKIEDNQGVNLNSIYLTIDNDFGIYQGVIRSGFDGYLANEGYGYYGEIERIASFEPLKTVNISLSARDLANNPASTVVRSFITQDNLPPRLENLKPQDQSSQVSPNAIISFDLRTSPKETEININSFRFIVAGIELDGYGIQALDSYGELVKTTLVEPDSLGQLVYDRRVVSIGANQDGLGYSVQYIPLNALPLSGRITLFIQVEDKAGNLLDSETSFTTIDDSAPILLDALPFPGSTNNSVGTGISFTLSDRQESFLGSGVNQESIQVKINGLLAVKDGLAEPGYSLNLIHNKTLNGFNLEIASLALFNPRSTINIDVEASDFNGNDLLTSYSFTTNDVIAPTLEWASPKFETGSAPLNLPILIKIKSEVSVQELDITSLVLTLDGSTIFENNSFQGIFKGRLFSESLKVLVVSVEPSLLSLDTNYTLHLSISDIFGNQLQSTNNFKTTNTQELQSFILPSPGIYSKGSSISFPEIGNLITITLSSNLETASIFYTTDGSDPVIDQDGNPLGTTLLYQGAQTFLTNQSLTIRYFAYDPILEQSEGVNNAFYFFSKCAETFEIEDSALLDGEDYLLANIRQADLVDSNLIPAINQKIAKANYTYDIGRLSYIDSLDFENQGFVKFKARSSETLEGLKDSPWTGQFKNLYQNNSLIISEGYQVSIVGTSGGFNISLESKQSLWQDSTSLKFNDSIGKGFDVGFGLELGFNSELFYGASAGIEISDDNYSLKIETIVSKVDRESNTLIGGTIEVFLDDGYLENYDSLIDGYEGYIVEIQTPTLIEETLNLVETLTINLVDGYDLPSDLGEIFNVFSYTEAVYNKFNFSSSSEGVRYTSALVGEINYKKIVANNQIGFALAAKDVPLDVSTAKLTSENLDQNLDQFVFAETSDFFEKTLFLEIGDYNFRFYIEYLVDGVPTSRIQTAPYLLKTKENLELVEYLDVLTIQGKEYKLASAARASNGDWYFDFFGDFPLDYQGSWTLKRNGVQYLASSEEILKENTTNAQVGFDAEGIVGNLVIESRGSLLFKYASKIATKISLVGTFNRFDKSQDIMARQLDPTPLKSIFDGIEDSYYTNDFANWHRLTIEPTLPLIVEKIRFKTLSTDGYQRARILFDGKPVDKSTYKAKDSLGNLIEYQNNTDLFLPQDQTFVEWNFFKRANETNSKLHNKIELWTRFDNGVGTRKHSELEIYSLPELPLLVADYVVAQDLSRIERLNKTGFTSDTNLTAIRYSRVVDLSESIKQPIYLENDGVLDNFLSARIITNGAEENTYYLDRSYLFNIGDKLVSSDLVTTLRATLLEIVDPLAGLIRTDKPLHQSGKIVKDYQVIEDNEKWSYLLDVPDYKIAFTGSIVDLIILSQQTRIFFLSQENVDPETLLGGKFTYPLLSGSAKVIDAQRSLADDGITKLFILTIDRELSLTQDRLAAIVEIFNSTKTVVDFTISKETSKVRCLNQSELCLNSTKIGYETFENSIPIPEEMNLILPQSSLSNVEIKVILDDSRFFLKDLEKLRITFFNGFEARSPSEVLFVVNEKYHFSVSIEEASILDGYSEALYNPLFRETGQILGFDRGLDGYFSDNLESFENLKASFEGEEKYLIGDILVGSNESLEDTNLKITLNDQVKLINQESFNKNKVNFYQIGFTETLLQIQLNGKNIFQDSIAFQNPSLEFFAVGKTFGDRLDANFSNVQIQKYFTTSPAKLILIGRFLEVEGEILNL